MGHSSSAQIPASDYCQFVIEDFRLQSGLVLDEAILVYKTYGTLNRDRSNVILYPTSYGAQHMDIDWLVGPDGILDSSQYFVVIPNMFGNGLSSSPGHFQKAPGGDRIPLFTHIDNLNAQRQMLAKVFDIQRLALVYGWSMGGQQALHWGAVYPDAVDRIAAICTSARTSPHNRVFLEGLKSVLTTDVHWQGDHFTAKPEKALKAFGRVYAGWALSQAFYREHLYLKLGYESLEDFLVKDWEASFLRRDPANLLSMIETWKHSDISHNDLYHDDLKLALGSIKALTYLLPGQTDLYFTAEDSQAEASQIPNSRFLPIPSIWGHRAGNPSRNPADQLFLKNAIAELLSTK